jgi:hypothetical protein
MRFREGEEKSRYLIILDEAVWSDGLEESKVGGRSLN